MSNLTVLGIDPGTPKSRVGLCVWNGEKILKITTIQGDKIFDELVQTRIDNVVTVIGVEVNPSTHTYERPGVSYRVMRKIARDVGRNFAAAVRIVAFAQGLGFQVVQVAPKNTKMDPELFKKITKYRKRTSSHARDAWGVARRVYADVYFQNKVREAEHNEA